MRNTGDRLADLSQFLWLHLVDCHEIYIKVQLILRCFLRNGVAFQSTGSYDIFNKLCTVLFNLFFVYYFHLVCFRWVSVHKTTRQNNKLIQCSQCFVILWTYFFKQITKFHYCNYMLVYLFRKYFFLFLFDGMFHHKFQNICYKTENTRVIQRSVYRGSLLVEYLTTEYDWLDRQLNFII